MENMKNLHLSSLYLICHKVRGAGNNQFECVSDTAFAAKEGELYELADLMCINRQRCQHIVFGNVIQDVIFFGNCFR